MQRHAHPGAEQHAQIVGAVTHRDHVGCADTAPRGDLRQGPDLGLAPQDGPRHVPGQAAILGQKPVGAVLVKAQHRWRHGR